MPLLLTGSTGSTLMLHGVLSGSTGSTLMLYWVLTGSIGCCSSTVELACPDDDGWLLHYETRTCFKRDQFFTIAAASLWREHVEQCTRLGPRYDVYKPRSRSQYDFVRGHTPPAGYGLVETIIIGFITCGHFNADWCYYGENQTLDWYEGSFSTYANSTQRRHRHCGKIIRSVGFGHLWQGEICEMDHGPRRTSRLCEFEAINYLPNITAAVRRGHAEELRTALNFYALTSKIGNVSESEAQIYLDKIHFKYNISAENELGLALILEVVREYQVDCVNAALNLTSDNRSALEESLKKKIFGLDIDFNENAVVIDSVLQAYEHKPCLRHADLQMAVNDAHSSLLASAFRADSRTKIDSLLFKIGVKEYNVGYEYQLAQRANMSTISLKYVKQVEDRALGHAILSDDGPTTMKILANNGFVDARIDTRQDGVVHSRNYLPDNYGQKYVQILSPLGPTLDEEGITLNNVLSVVREHALVQLENSVRSQTKTEFMDALYHPSLRLGIPCDSDGARCIPFLTDFTLHYVEAFIQDNVLPGCLNLNLNLNLMKRTLLHLKDAAAAKNTSMIIELLYDPSLNLDIPDGWDVVCFLPLFEDMLANFTLPNIEAITKEPSPCLHGGQCINTDNITTCECDVGYTGGHCEEDIDLCASHPCENGADCTDIGNGIKCACTKGYVGETCGHRSQQKVISDLTDNVKMLKDKLKGKVYRNELAKVRDLILGNSHLWVLLLFSVIVDVTICGLVKARRRVRKWLGIKNTGRSRQKRPQLSSYRTYRNVTGKQIIRPRKGTYTILRQTKQKKTTGASRPGNIGSNRPRVETPV